MPFDWAETAWSAAGASTAPATATSPPHGRLLGRDDLRIISCHLGGSSSLCAIRNGQSVATSMGMSPQSGLPHNNRVGDFDPFALPLVMRADRQVAGEVLDDAGQPERTAGTERRERDFRDIDEAAAAGNARAQLAMDVFAAGVRHYLGAYLVELGGADVIVFTGGIGENRAAFRAAVCGGLEELGIVPRRGRPTPPAPARSQIQCCPAAACRFGSCRPTRN